MWLSSGASGSLGVSLVPRGSKLQVEESSHSGRASWLGCCCFLFVCVFAFCYGQPKPIFSWRNSSSPGAEPSCTQTGSRQCGEGHSRAGLCGSPTGSCQPAEAPADSGCTLAISVPQCRSLPVSGAGLLALIKGPASRGLGEPGNQLQAEWREDDALLALNPQLNASHTLLSAERGRSRGSDGRERRGVTRAEIYCPDDGMLPRGRWQCPLGRGLRLTRHWLCQREGSLHSANSRLVRG